MEYKIILTKNLNILNKRVYDFYIKENKEWKKVYENSELVFIEEYLEEEDERIENKALQKEVDKFNKFLKKEKSDFYIRLHNHNKSYCIYTKGIGGIELCQRCLSTKDPKSLEKYILDTINSFIVDKAKSAKISKIKDQMEINDKKNELLSNKIDEIEYNHRISLLKKLNNEKVSN